MKILVTGGAGFIGSHIVDLLIKQDHQVLIIDNLSTGSKDNLNPQAKFFPGDILSSALDTIFQENQPEIVIHLAAQLDINYSVQEPVKDAEINILGSINLLENCRKYKVKKIIYTSSAAEIGEPLFFPITEEHPLNPISPYGVSKHCVQYYLKIYSNLYHLNYTYLRYANVYGPRQGLTGEGGVVSTFIKKLLNNIPMTIFGTGQQTRDFIYVQDVAEATILMLNQGNNQIYNVGTGKETSINTLFGMINILLNKSSLSTYLKPKSGDIQRSVFSIEKIKKEIGWQPKVELEEGLIKTINFFKKVQSPPK